MSQIELRPGLADVPVAESAISFIDGKRARLEYRGIAVETLARELGMSMDKVPLTAPQYGNTGAASIPITMHRANAERPFERGERLLLAAVGGGMTAGAAVLVWH